MAQSSTQQEETTQKCKEARRELHSTKQNGHRVQEQQENEIFLRKTGRPSEFTCQRKGFSEKKKTRRELKTKEATDMQNLRTIDPKHLSIMTNMRVPPSENQLTVTLLRHCHGYFYFWFLAPSPISHFLVAFCFHWRCCELLSL